MEHDILYYLYGIYGMGLFAAKILIFVLPILIILHIRKKDRQKQVERYNRMYNQDVKDRE